MGFLLGLINPISAVAKQIAVYETAKVNATTDQERIEAEQQIAALNARKAVLIAESRHPWNMIMRGLLALPVVILLWWIMVFNKVLGIGSVTMSPDLWHVVWIVLGFYFVDNIVNRVRRG